VGDGDGVGLSMGRTGAREKTSATHMIYALIAWTLMMRGEK
jgi:hypothetical protein